MFTGIIEELGRVAGLLKTNAGMRLRIAAKNTVQGLTLGGSVAVEGVCLTAVEVSGDAFAADLAPETLRRTTFSRLKLGSAVNLERPLRMRAELGGHFVQGHVDATGRVSAWKRLQDARELALEIPVRYDHLVVEKGSIAVNGVSLTIAGRSRGRVRLALIPHTLDVTTLGRLRVGQGVNLEFDYLAKLVAAMMARRSPGRAPGKEQKA